jgi:hypothetical protein
LATPALKNRVAVHAAQQPKNAAELIVSRSDRAPTCFPSTESACRFSLLPRSSLRFAVLGESVDILEAETLQFSVNAMNDVVELRVGFGGIHFGDALGFCAILLRLDFE